MKKLSLFLFLILIACNSSKFHNEEEMLITFLKSDTFLKNKKCVVLIPAYGCGKCTDDIIDYSIKNYQNKNILFIFSDMTNKTDILLKEKKDYRRHIIIDKFDELKSGGLVFNKPVALFIKDNQIQEIVKFDDTTSQEIISRIEADGKS